MALPKGFKSYFVFLDEENTNIQYSRSEPDGKEFFRTFLQARRRVIEHLRDRSREFAFEAKQWRAMTEEAYGLDSEWEPEE